MVATTDPATLPKLTTWYLLTNLARPASRRPQQAQLAEIVEAYGLRNWVEQGYKQVKDELGWVDFQVSSSVPPGDAAHAGKSGGCPPTSVLLGAGEAVSQFDAGSHSKGCALLP